MKRSAIPTPVASDPGTRAFMLAVKENVELLNGVRGTPINPVNSAATLADVISTLNQIIDRMSK